ERLDPGSARRLPFGVSALLPAIETTGKRGRTTEPVTSSETTLRFRKDFFRVSGAPTLTLKRAIRAATVPQIAYPGLEMLLVKIDRGKAVRLPLILVHRELRQEGKHGSHDSPVPVGVTALEEVLRQSELRTTVHKDAQLSFCYREAKHRDRRAML